MLSKKHDPFISLKKEVKEIKAEAPQEIQYPSLYLNEIDNRKWQNSLYM